MSQSLDKTARRIVGVLIEKQLCTPNHYPLTLNALTNGCNQKSNRNPILMVQEFEVEGALRTLYVHEWVTNVTGAGSRVLKWKHRFDERLDLNDSELPILAELLLRGAQTAGELRSRVARMKRFEDLAALTSTLGTLQERGLVTLAEHTPGRRAQLYDHTLYEEGEQEVPSMPAAAAPVDPPQPTPGSTDRIAELEQEVGDLRSRIARIESELDLGEGE